MYGKGREKFEGELKKRMVGNGEVMKWRRREGMMKEELGFVEGKRGKERLLE